MFLNYFDIPMLYPVPVKCVDTTLKKVDHKILLSVHSTEKYFACNTISIGSCWGNRRERDHWGDLGVDGWKILGWISRRLDVAIWTGLGWPMVGTGGGLL